MKNKLKWFELAIRNRKKNGIIFVSVFALTLLGLSALIPRLDIHADPEPPAYMDYEDITFNLHWVNTYVNVWINDRSVMDESQNFQSDEFTYNNVVVDDAGTTDPSETNAIRLQNRFGDLMVTEYTINGTVYNEQSENVSIADDDSWTITLPGASTYTISGTGDSSLAVPRTIIWANVDADHSAEDFDEDMLLEHGRGKVIAIYDGNIQVAGETDVDEATGMGWVQVTPGNQVVFEFVPEYGYQLTSVLANGFPLEPQDTVNQYVFDMPDTNIHFAAVFERTEDVVEANSEKVTSGSIVFNGGLANGSAQLIINDIELSADKIAGFGTAAGEYEIVNYLDIDLYNVFHKANAADDEVWSNKVDELSKEAVIKIRLAEGIDAKNIVIVHNIHDGEEYEIIEIDSYDPVTNIITFKSKSFSSYAIATSDKAANSPDTGKNTMETGSATLIFSGSAVIFAAIAILICVLFNKNIIKE